MVELSVGFLAQSLDKPGHAKKVHSLLEMKHVFAGSASAGPNILARTGNLRRDQSFLVRPLFYIGTSFRVAEFGFVRLCVNERSMLHLQRGASWQLLTRTNIARLISLYTGSK